MRSTFKVSFFLKRNQPNKVGNVPVIARITVDGRISEFSTKLDIQPDKWNVKQGKATGRNTDSVNLNTTLEIIKGNIYKHYHRLQEQDDYVTAEKVKRAFLGLDEKGKTILYFFEKHNKQYRLKVGQTTTNLTYSRYELTKQRLTEFIRKEYSLSDIMIKDIDLLFIERFELFIRREYNCGNNTAMKFVQKLRTILYFAQNTGLIFADPFSNYRIHLKKVDRGYLTEDEIFALMKKEFSTKRLEHVRDIFLFSCFTGLAYIDVKNLTKNNIRKSFDNKTWGMTKRQKTGIDVNVPLLEIPAMILEKYNGILPDGTLLPVLSNQKMNAYLKEIGDLCGINKSLTFHLSRHTFATYALTKGVPIETVSKMLGHTNITTTQIYARITDGKVSSDMQDFSEKVKGMEKVYQP